MPSYLCCHDNPGFLLDIPRSVYRDCLTEGGRLDQGLAANSRSNPEVLGYMRAKATLWAARDHRNMAAMDVAMPVAPAP